MHRIAGTAVHRKEGPSQQGHQIIAAEVISDRAGPLRAGQERFGDTLQVVRGPRGGGPLGTTPTAVALAWVRSRPGVTSVIIGPRTVDQLEENLVGFRLDLPNELAGRLDDISRSGVR